MSPAERVAGLGTTIFTEMSALALRTGAINLGQGFPDTDGPASVIEAAVAALRGGHNQYAPLPGVPALRDAVFEHQRSWYGLDPEDVLITFGATEAIASALLGLCDPGDEVVVLEPYYDSYAACIAFAGATRRPVTLRPPGFEVGAEALRAAIGPRARVLLLNTPHNPTGRVLSSPELGLIAGACVEHDLICVTDEVYEHLVYDREHIPLASLDGMRERTISVSSAGKAFSFTGWKVGWVTGTPEIVNAVRTTKQFLTFVTSGPFQYAVAAALALPDAYFESLAGDLKKKRDLLADGLAGIGFEVYQPDGTYFITTDIAPLGEPDGIEFCLNLPERAGVVAIPTAVFYDDKEAGRTQVRFAFCKRPEILEEALSRLAVLAR
jgi:N-succinyldiaminopimelate aminotransferase